MPDSLRILGYLPAILVALPLIGGLLLIIAIQRAPDGTEDDTGFHSP